MRSRPGSRMIAPWRTAQARRYLSDGSRDHLSDQRIQRRRAQAARRFRAGHRARARRRRTPGYGAPRRPGARALPLSPGADPSAPGGRAHGPSRQHGREPHRGGNRLGARDAGCAARAGRPGAHRGDALHEPLLQHQAVLLGRRLLPCLPEEASRLEPGVRARPQAGRHQAGRPDSVDPGSMKTADAVIIGGGVTGCSLAHALTGMGASRVLVLERRFIGAGGTGRSVGIIRQLYPTRETTEMVLRSLRVFERFSEAVGGDSGFVRSGVLIGVSAAMRPSLEKTLALQRDAGVEAEILEPSSLSKLEPTIDPSALGAVLYEPGSGYGDPSAVTAGYADAARRQGVAIEQGQEVAAIHSSRGRVTGVETTVGERIDAPVVVNAAGLWSPAVARLAGIDLPIIIGRHPLFVLERDASFGRAHTVYLDLAGGSYVRPETGGFTLTGSLIDDETQH